MSSRTVQYARVSIMLVYKDMKVLTKNFGALIVDCFFPLCAQILTFGYLFPVLGMPSTMIAPVYLGSMLSLFLQLGFTSLMRMAGDLNNNRFIDYQRTLPLSKRWLFGAYIVSSMLEIALIAFPLIASGLLILHTHIPFEHVSWFALSGVMLINLLFFATFFLACAIYFDFYWLLDNMWPRVLSPLFCTSAALVVWKSAYAWSPVLAGMMLFSPFTYVVEGMRSAFLGSDLYLSPIVCMGALLLFIAGNIALLRRGIIKKLDPI